MGPALAAVGLVAGLAVAGAGCSDEPAESQPVAPSVRTAFGAALKTVSAGTIPVGTGYGWIDVEALGGGRAGAGALDWAARALGPGGSDLVVDRGPIGRRTGVELDRAARLLASATSYTVSVRADGVDTSSLRAGLRRAATSRARRQGWELFNLGPPWAIPFGSAAEVFGSLGARPALAARRLVLARSAQARVTMIGAGASPLADPAVRLAIACLGDVVAARIVPNNFTHAPNSGPELLAFGVRDAAGRAPHEVLCALDSSAEAARGAERALSKGLALETTDVVTGEEIGDLISSAEIGYLESDGAYAASAELVLRRGERPGFVFGAFVRGSLVTYLGVSPPPGV